MKTMFCISLFLAALLSSAALYAQDAPVTVPSKAQAAKAQPEDAKQKESAPAQSVGGPPMIGVVAVVGSDVISSIDLQDRMRLILGTTRIEDSPETRRRLVPQALRVLVDEQLQMQEATAEGITVGEQDIKEAIGVIEKRSNKPEGSLEADLAARGLPARSFYNQIKAQIAWSKLIIKKIRPRIRVSDEEVARVRKKATSGVAAGSGREEVQIATIVLPVDSPANEANVKALAEKLVSEIHAGAAFDDVARQFATGGAGQATEAFWVEPSQLDPLITKALTGVEPQNITAPVRTLNGYQIVRLLDKRTGSGGPQTMKQAEVAMKQITMKLRMDASPKEAELLMKVAKDVAKNPGTCMSPTIANVENLSDLDIDVKFIRNLLTRLPEKVQTIVNALTVGQVSDPFASEMGIQVFILCERIDLPDMAMPETTSTADIPEDQIRARLFNEKLELEAQKYLRNLRREAFIEVRLR
jgi:peptidyl-prolyl cis-trans isomerase SurA